MKKISQRDIAKTLGVNVSTVSRALKGQKGVSEELRQQIERMAAEQGYQPVLYGPVEHYNAKRIIGIVVPEGEGQRGRHIGSDLQCGRRSAYHNRLLIQNNLNEYETD